MKASRVLYGLAQQRALPTLLARVHPRTRTPLVATALATGVALVLSASLPLATLAETSSLVTLTTFALANLALVRIKRRAPAPPGTTRVPAWIPAVGFLVSFGFIVFEALHRIAGG
jgi:amino acid transporter